MLDCAGYRLPNKIRVNGFLTINGKKMSKSRGTFILASKFFEAGINPDCLRYYFASKLSSKTTDIDLSFNDFCQKINSDLIGKLINIGSRCSGFIFKQNAGKLATAHHDIIKSALSKSPLILDMYENCEYQNVIKEVMSIADSCNQYISTEEPWVLIKNPDTIEQAITVCSVALNIYFILACYLQPIMPKLTAHIAQQINQQLQWPDIESKPLATTINKFKPFLTKIDSELLTEKLSD